MFDGRLARKLKAVNTMRIPRISRYILLLGVVLFPLCDIRSHGLGNIEEDFLAKRMIKNGWRVSKDENGKVDIIGGAITSDHKIEEVNFSVFTRLSCLTVFGDGMTDRSMRHLRKTIPELLALSVASTQISDNEFPLLLKSQHSLSSLAIMNSPITDKTLVHVGKLQRLFSLSLRGTKIGNKGITHLAGLKRLLVLDLSRTSISDGGLGEIAKLKTLTCLLLVGKKVTDDGIQQLAKLTELRELDISETLVTQAGVDALRLQLPMLAITLKK